MNWKKKWRIGWKNLYSLKIRLSSPQKSIWLYTGFTFEEIVYSTIKCNQSRIRKIILNNIDVLIDGQYIESQRDITLPYRGSSNQRLIDAQQSLQKGEIVLWQT